VLFPAGDDGLWCNNAFVILSSADDVNKALARHGRCIGNDSVKGSSIKLHVSSC